MFEDGVLLKDMVYFKRNIPESIIIKTYYGGVPACGVFCGGCPTYTRDKKPCLGAEQNKEKCERCKTFHLCCTEKESLIVINVQSFHVQNLKASQNDG